MTGTRRKTWDVVVVGAGCFGAGTAWQLRAAGRSVLLVDQYGPANARASSGGESRPIRMSYGPDELYTRFSHRSLTMWKAFFVEVENIMQEGDTAIDFGLQSGDQIYVPRSFWADPARFTWIFTAIATIVTVVAIFVVN